MPPNEVVGNLDALQRLVEVENVDAIALTENEALHLRVPLAGLVPEMNAGFQHLAHRDDSHGVCLLSCGSVVQAPGAEATAGGHLRVTLDYLTGPSCWAVARCYRRPGAAVVLRR